MEGRAFPKNTDYLWNRNRKRSDPKNVFIVTFWEFPGNRYDDEIFN